jgi:mannan endo-1,4-beta-mannosidase
LTDTQRLGRHRQGVPANNRPARWPGRAKVIAVIITLSVIIAAVAGFELYNAGHPAQAASRTAAGSFIGLYSHDSPASYAGVTAFTNATGARPNVTVYYSGWLEPFKAGFATTAAHAGAVTLVQMDPTNISLTAIASGRYDGYLDSYAQAVRAYKAPVLLSFGHEMNGDWYSWAYKHTSPAVFVAAWRHVVTLFRTQKVRNVTWVWTVNNIVTQTGIPSPLPWWPGKSYVNWVGIDGYFTTSAETFSAVFGPTVVSVRSITTDPILITETSATPASAQPAKIADLFAGVRLYDLLGFIWFDSAFEIDWRLSAAALAEYRKDAVKYKAGRS